MGVVVPPLVGSPNAVSTGAHAVAAAATGSVAGWPAGWAGDSLLVVEPATITPAASAAVSSVFFVAVMAFFLDLAGNQW
jgi:hypothetical protein